jgi:hypothetical protein
MTCREHFTEDTTMRSTQDAAGVGTDAVVQGIVDTMLSARESLPHSSNGRPIAPSSAKAAQIRKDMRQGVSREWARLLEVSRCDAEDGVAPDQVEAPYWLAIAAIRHAARIRSERPVLAISRNETRTEAPLNLAQLRLAESPACAEALQAVIDAAERHLPNVVELRDGCRAELTVIRAQAPRQTRPGHMQVMA